MRRNAFTLVELVMVVMILGIISAVAAPKVAGVGSGSKEVALRTDLGLLRDAVNLYSAVNAGALPGDAGTETDLKADLAPFLRKFPTNAVKGSAVVAMQTAGVPMTGTVNGSVGWRYDNKTGQLIANSNGTSSDGTRYCDL